MPDDKTLQKDRWNEIQDIWRDNGWMWLIPGLVIGCVIGFLVGISSTADIDHWFLAGMWPNVLTAGITIGLIDRIIRAQNTRTEKERLKSELKWQIRSRSTDVAVSAIDRMREENWLQGEAGLLKECQLSHYHPAKWNGANLAGANLEGAMLEKAELEGAQLLFARLEYGNLIGAQLRKSGLSFAKFRGSSLYGANLSDIQAQQLDMTSCYLDRSNLQRAFLFDACFANASLRGVNAKDANLQYANLNGACLAGADFTGAFLYGACYLREPFIQSCHIA